MNILIQEDKNIIEELKKSLILNNPPKITQQRFDSIIETLINDDKRELMWNLSKL